MPKAKLPVARAKRLPKTFRGASVVRGLGMTGEQIDKLVDKKAISRFDWFGEPRNLFLVVSDDCLRGHGSTSVKAFVDEAAAVRYARAMGNGNVNQRVLHVTDQTLVIATESELEDE
jgi:hypothetical protein